MSIIEYEGLKIELDDEDYLVNFEDWNEKVAHALAEREGIKELTKDMMAIIKFMRQYYEQYKVFPVLRSVCKNIHQPENCVFEQFIDPLKAWKIAGLPKPAGEVMAYLSGFSK